MIIEEINRRFNLWLNSQNVDPAARWQMQIIREGQIYILRGNKTYTLQGQEVK